MWAVNEWMQRTHPLMGLFSYEVGGKQRHGHLQGTMTLRWPGDDYHAGVLKKAFEELLVVGPSDQKHFTVKVLRDGQRPIAMIGYCTKDKGKSTFDFARYNVTDEDLVAGMLEYQRLSLNYKEGRMEIDKWQQVH